MIGHVDLLPASCRETFARQRTRRRWLLGYCALLVVLALGYSGVTAHYRSVDDQRDALRTQVQDRLLKNEEAGLLLTQIRTLEDRLTRYNTLAWPVRMTEVMDSVGSIVPSGTTLTSLTLSPRTERIRTPAAKGKPAHEQTKNWLTVELQGIALDDITVSQIVSGLDENPLFSRVSLDFARQREVDGVEAREFRVQAEVDLDARYAFAELAEGGDE